MLLAFWSGAIFSPDAWAQQLVTGNTFTHELTGGTDSVFTFAGGNTTIGVALGYRYYLLPDYGLQIGYDTSLSYETAGDNGFTAWTNFFGIRYNFTQFTQAMMNQFFVDLGIGFQLNHTSISDITSSNTNFLFRVGVGKRFGIFGNVAWVPEVTETDIATQGWSLTIIPIAISILFGPS